jgi:thiol-disulfide isomerase/thioredoxin
MCALAGGTVAAAALWRKPPPDILSPVGPPEAAPALLGPSALVESAPRALPAVTLFDAAGAAHPLAEFAGRGVVLNLWATWCVPCVAELPALASLAARGASSGLVVAPMSSDRGGADVVRSFYKNHRLDALPIWLDPKGEAGRALGARGIPTTLVIDRKGFERARLEGAADWASDAMLARLQALIG